MKTNWLYWKDKDVTDTDFTMFWTWIAAGVKHLWGWRKPRSVRYLWRARAGAGRKCPVFGRSSTPWSNRRPPEVIERVKWWTRMLIVQSHFRSDFPPVPNRVAPPPEWPSLPVPILKSRKETSWSTRTTFETRKEKKIWQLFTNYGSLRPGRREMTV